MNALCMPSCGPAGASLATILNPHPKVQVFPFILGMSKRHVQGNMSMFPGSTIITMGLFKRLVQVQLLDIS